MECAPDEAGLRAFLFGYFSTNYEWCCRYRAHYSWEKTHSFCLLYRLTNCRVRSNIRCEKSYGVNECCIKSGVALPSTASGKYRLNGWLWTQWDEVMLSPFLFLSLDERMNPTLTVAWVEPDVNSLKHRTSIPSWIREDASRSLKRFQNVHYRSLILTIDQAVF